MKKSDKILAISLIILVILSGVIYYYWDKVDEGDSDGGGNQVAVVNDFDECMAAGYAIEESYPRQCQTPDGRTFVEDIGNEMEKSDLIRISYPRPNTAVTSPIRITGEARGRWFFEASFPIKMYDADGKEIGSTIAAAKSDWMTEEFVPFEAVLDFPPPGGGKGTLVLQRDNPSELPENDDQLKVPIVFASKASLQEVSLYYYDPEKDKDTSGNVQCSDKGLVPVKRDIPQGGDVIKNTIELLLQGIVTQSEKNSGITTEYPLQGLSLKTSDLNDGVLTLTFDDPNNKTVGGACRVGVLWAQINATAKQFPEVKEVKFSPDTLFQP